MGKNLNNASTHTHITHAKGLSVIKMMMELKRERTDWYKSASNDNYTKTGK